MVKTAPFPSQAPIDPAAPRSLGIDYDYLKKLKQKFENEWQWAKLEKKVNAFDHFLVDYNSANGDELRFHFVHQRSERADAIPLFLFMVGQVSHRFVSYLRSYSPTTFGRHIPRLS